MHAASKRGLLFFAHFALSLVIVAVLGACASLERHEPVSEVHVVYDPANSNIPLPNDLARDEKAAHLDLPITVDLAPAEVEFRRFMNTHDAWPTTFPLQAEFSAPIDPKSIKEDNLLVYEWGDTPTRVVDATITLDGAKLTVDPPRTGWRRGARYVVAVVGGRYGVRDAAGKAIGPDETFYFLRARTRLDTYDNNTAFPGDTRAERLAKGAKLEKVRAGLVPFFDALEKQTPKIAREDLSALWTFTVTTATELAMDAPSQRVPLPFDPLIDAKTKRVTLPPSTFDSARDASAKLQLNETNGFGVASSLMFELTQAVDSSTANPTSVHVYALGASPHELRVDQVRVLPSDGAASCATLPIGDSCTHIVVSLAEEELPLAPATTYALVVDDRLRPRDGGVLRPMIMGHFLRAQNPLVANGKSTVVALPLDKAELLESVRSKVDALLRTPVGTGALGRDHIVAAWSFTTMDAAPGLRDALKLPDTAAFDPTPNITSRKDIAPGALGAAGQSEVAAFSGLFPGVTGTIIGSVYVPRIRGVRTIVEGTFASPYTLDRATRGVRADHGFEREDVHFVLTLPDRSANGAKIPVMMFGHGLMTDRRFVLTIAGALARRGFGAISFDFPFHGERTKCTQRSLVAFPNPLPPAIRKLDPSLGGDLLSFPPCPSGATCSADGRCLGANGNDVGYAMLPTTAMPVAGGSALIDVDDIPHVPNRMRQAVIDTAAMRRVLRLANWSLLLGGIELETSRVFYSGQSLGGILGAVYVAIADDVERAVLNVPGADEVDLFNQSTFFKPQMDDFFTREKLELGSFERERLMSVAHWLIDTVDPQAVAGLLKTRPVYMQMDQGDIIIPNFVTKRLQRATNLPMKTYPSPLHGDLVIPGVGDTMLDELVSYLVDGTTH